MPYPGLNTPAALHFKTTSEAMIFRKKISLWKDYLPLIQIGG